MSTVSLSRLVVVVFSISFSFLVVWLLLHTPFVRLKARSGEFRECKNSIHSVGIRGDSDATAWYICKSLLPKEPIVYGFGCAEDFGFELDMLLYYNAHVRAFDLDPETKRYENIIKHIKEDEYFRVIPIDMVTKDEPASTPRKQKAKMELRSLPTLMEEMGDMWVDVIKIDISGAEYGVLKQSLEDGELQATQLLVRWHDNGRKDGLSKLKEVRILLQKRGWVIMHHREGVEKELFINSQFRKQKMMYKKMHNKKR